MLGLIAMAHNMEFLYAGVKALVCVCIFSIFKLSMANKNFIRAIFIYLYTHFR